MLPSLVPKAVVMFGPQPHNLLKVGLEAKRYQPRYQSFT